MKLLGLLVRAGVTAGAAVMLVVGIMLVLAGVAIYGR